MTKEQAIDTIRSNLKENKTWAQLTNNCAQEFKKIMPDVILIEKLHKEFEKCQNQLIR